MLKQELNPKYYFFANDYYSHELIKSTKEKVYRKFHVFFSGLTLKL